MKLRKFIPLSLILLFVVTCSMHAQDSNSEEGISTDSQIENQGYDWSVKVIWVDVYGDKQKSKGRLLLAHNGGIMIREDSRSGRPMQKSISARSIIKLKYRSGNSPGRGALTGAADGFLNGNPLQLSTGNVYFDVLSGVLSGALMGLANNSSGSQRTVWVNRDSRIYVERVLPDLGLVETVDVEPRN